MQGTKNSGMFSSFNTFSDEKSETRFFKRKNPPEMYFFRGILLKINCCETQAIPPLPTPGERWKRPRGCDRSARKQ